MQLDYDNDEFFFDRLLFPPTFKQAMICFLSKKPLVDLTVLGYLCPIFNLLFLEGRFIGAYILGLYFLSGFGAGYRTEMA